MSNSLVGWFAFIGLLGLTACSQEASKPAPKVAVAESAATPVPEKSAPLTETAATAVAPIIAPTQQSAICTGGDGKQYPLSDMLEWCSRDHGFNEGAKCGAEALSGQSVGGVPAVAASAILGNTWDRTNMIGAARAAAKANRGPELDGMAARAATCCQIHNGPIHNCLAGNQAAVVQWLKR